MIHWVPRGEKEKPKCIPLKKNLGAILYLVGKASKGGQYQDKSPARGGSQGQALDSGNAPCEGGGLTVSNELQEEILQTSNGQDKMAGS